MKFGAGSPRPPADTKKLEELLLVGNMQTDQSPPPYTKSPEPIKVTKPAANKNVIRARNLSQMNPSPDGNRSVTPRSTTPRSHSPFPMEDRDSPMTPVGENLYHGDYIYQPSPRVSRPAQPAQAGEGTKPVNLYSADYLRQEIPKSISKPAKPPTAN